MRVAPYINGRIFDQATAQWESHGRAAAAKAVAGGGPSLMDAGATPLQLYNESYGSEAGSNERCCDAERKGVPLLSFHR